MTWKGADMTQPTTRIATREDIAAVANIAAKTLFPADMTEPMMAPFLDGADDVLWCVVEHSGEVAGFAFAQAEPMTDRSWNLKAIAIKPAAHRKGLGVVLLSAIENTLRDRQGRVLVVDTASGPDQLPARAFYAAQGFAQAGIIPDFWEEGEDKVTFCKGL